MRTPSQMDCWGLPRQCFGPDACDGVFGSWLTKMRDRRTNPHRTKVAIRHLVWSDALAYGRLVEVAPNDDSVLIQ